MQSVTGAGATAHASVPSRAITVTGRNVPSFFGMSGSIRYASAMATDARMFAYEELMNDVTCG